MASARLPRQLLLKARRAASSPRPASSLQCSSRSFNTQRLSSLRPALASKNPLQASKNHIRLISAAAPQFNATQAAPKADAYISSGHVPQAKDLVNVKKVLVIGSGGLAIGQAGEFDYSGELYHFPIAPVSPPPH